MKDQATQSLRSDLGYLLSIKLDDLLILCVFMGGGECTEERINLTLISSFSGGRGGGQRAREREGQRQRQIERDRERERQTDRQTETERERERERGRD